ncbi:MAG: hypothetical protein KKC55_17490 [Gammaproteobacteria bacterium]|nr:hypothetical protein [Gammaproteobacteria bacterium]
MELSKSDLGIIAEKLTNKAVDKVMDDPLAAIMTADSILSIAVNVLPTLPWETPFPIPRVIYEKLKKAEGK